MSASIIYTYRKLGSNKHTCKSGLVAIILYFYPEGYSANIVEIVICPLYSVAQLRVPGRAETINQPALVEPENNIAWLRLNAIHYFTNLTILYHSKYTLTKTYYIVSFIKVSVHGTRSTRIKSNLYATPGLSLYGLIELLTYKASAFITFQQIFIWAN